MSGLVSFIILTAGSTDALKRSMESISALADIVCETIVVAHSRDGNEWMSEFNECIATTRGAYIYPLSAGTEIVETVFRSQLEYLSQNERASLFVTSNSNAAFPIDKCAAFPTNKSAAIQTNANSVSGPVFLFTCFDKILAPVVTPENILFRKPKSTVALDPRFSHLAFSDLSFQLCRQGDVILGVDTDATFGANNDCNSVSLAETLPEWIHLAEKYASFLRCTGMSAEMMMEKLCVELMPVGVFENECLLPTEEFLPAVKDEGLEEEHKQKIMLSAQRLIENRGAITSKKRSLNFVVTTKEILACELELRRALQSRSWRFTKWMRDAGKALRSAKAGSGSSDVVRFCSSVEYRNYLTSQIETVYRSRSWYLSKPLRAIEQAQPHLSSLTLSL